MPRKTTPLIKKVLGIWFIISNLNEIEKKIKTISIFETFETHINSDELATIKEHHEQINEQSLIQTNLFKKIETLKVSSSENTLFLLLVILYLTEVPISFAINIFIYTLMLKGHHDVWFEQKQKFVSSFDELFDVPLSVKLKFLKNMASDSCLIYAQGK